MFRFVLRHHESIIINLALQVLHEATYATGGGVLGRLPVRLALRVLMPFVKERTPLTDFWTEFTKGNRLAWEGCHIPYGAIKASLEGAGWQVAEEDYPPPAVPVCAELGLSHDLVALIERFGIRKVDETDRGRPAQVARPGSGCWVITWDNASPQLRQAKWGIRRTVAGYSGGRAIEYVTNIRDPERTFWRRGSVEKGVLPAVRCIFPVREIGHRAAGVSTGPATEWYGMSNGEQFGIAGLWVGEPHLAAAMHVSEPNPAFAAFGDAMPLILHREDERRWLEHGDLDALALPFPSQLMIKLQFS
ncbi:hypothetical protein [Sphingomonas sp. LT1P40]|uniref:hypothetical protein n=1 Tax=Alteristakelama amylovorans TaxID=3096166 RepID=UPI002FC8F885